MDLCYVYLYKQAGAELEFELRGGQNLKQEKMRKLFCGNLQKDPKTRLKWAKTVKPQ